MIGFDELAESSRYMDALSEEQGYDAVVSLNGIDSEGLLYVAQQRALRAAMLMDGQDPSKLSRTVKTNVTLTKQIELMLPSLTALALDNLIIGVHAGRRAGRQDAG